jgi:hypothetical protein
MIAREWAGQLDSKTISGLARFTYLASVMHGERTTKPFLVHGVTARELHAAHHRPEQLGALEAAIQTTTRRESIAQALATHEDHDQRVRQAVEALHSGQATGAGPVSHGRTIHASIALEEDEGWDS